MQELKAYWPWIIVAGAIAIAVVVGVAEYYEAAASLETLLPSGETGGDR